ncbi:MAG: hypothetical protein V2A74_08670 [bacterium]
MSTRGKARKQEPSGNENLGKKLAVRDNREEVRTLFKNLKRELPALKELLRECSDHWRYEDGIYRFYHQSHKVYAVQDTTLRILECLKALSPNGTLNDWFMEIVGAGTGKTFDVEHNKNWLAITRPILEAFFHAKFFLEMAVKYGKELSYPPALLPSGWAAVLYLYNLR